MKKLLLILAAVAAGMMAVGQEPVWKAGKGQHTRWASFENPTGQKGQGGTENNTAKGHPFDRIPARPRPKGYSFT